MTDTPSYDELLAIIKQQAASIAALERRLELDSANSGKPSARAKSRRKKSQKREALECSSDPDKTVEQMPENNT